MDLEIVSRPDKSWLAEVIFVHGLDGHWRKTWHPKGQPEKFWLEWLGRDVPEVRIWSLDYEAKSIAWRGHTMSLPNRATNVLEKFAVNELASHPLIFVCHSMGGLLVKELLRQASLGNDPRWKSIAEQTRAIAFLSTPHRGARLATWVERIASFLFLRKLIRPTVSVKELQDGNPWLMGLNRWFVGYVREFDVNLKIYVESRKLRGLPVVDEWTADPGIAEVIPVPTDDDHVSISKPLSRDSLVYQSVKQMVEDTIRPFKVLPNTPSSRVKIEVRDVRDQPREIVFHLGDRTVPLPWEVPDWRGTRPVEAVRDWGNVLHLTAQVSSDFKELQGHIEAYSQTRNEHAREMIQRCVARDVKPHLHDLKDCLSSVAEEVKCSSYMAHLEGIGLCECCIERCACASRPRSPEFADLCKALPKIRDWLDTILLQIAEVLDEHFKNMQKCCDQGSPARCVLDRSRP